MAEKGYDPDTLDGHTFLCNDPSVITNETGYDNIHDTVATNVYHPSTDSQLRYCEFEILSSPSGIIFGFGYDSKRWLGWGSNALGFRFDNGVLYMLSSALVSGLNIGDVGDFGRLWVIGDRCWLGSYTVSNGYEIIGGGDPYTDTTPTFDFSSNNYSYPYRSPMVSCRNHGGTVRINTVGPFAHPPSSPAVPWDS